MKHFFLLLLAMVWMANAAYTQQDALNDFIEKHKNEQAFTYAFLSKDLFEVVTQADIEEKDWKKIQHVVKNIGSLRVLAADSIDNALPLYKEARALVPDDVFDELLTVRDGKDNVRIWAKTEESIITDLILLVGSTDEFVLVCFAGVLELGNIAELAALFEAGEIEELAQTTKAMAIDFNINPNPSDGEFTLSYDDESDPPALLSIIDQNGRQLSTLNLSGFPIQQVLLPALPPGMYWVQLKTRGGKVGVKQVQIIKK